MAISKILPFCTTDTGTNLLTDPDYAGANSLLVGHTSGRSSSRLFNKTLRQTSLLVSALAKFIADHQGTDIVDNLTLTQAVTALTAGLRATGGGATCLLNLNAPVSYTANVIKNIDWNVKILETVAGMFSAGDPSKLSVPVGFTEAKVSCGIASTSVQGNNIQATIWRNNVYQTVTPRAFISTSRGGDHTVFSIASSWMPVTVGDFFRVFVVHNDTATGTYVLGDDAQFQSSCYFSLEVRA
ncbi:MAG: hypothetical protein ACREVA_00260 [Burkholderiales bacterium]